VSRLTRQAAVAVFLLLLGLCFRCAPAARSEDKETPPEKPVESVLLKAMETELSRSVEKLKAQGTEPLYYLGYSVSENDGVEISAAYGSLTSKPSTDEESPRRRLSVVARVGSPKMDNTHKMREGYSFRFGGGGGMLPSEDDADAIRTALWLATDSEFKGAQQGLAEVKTNKAVKVAEEDTSDDFTVEEPHVSIQSVMKVELDKKAWAEKIKAYSALFKNYDYILTSFVSLEGGVSNRYFVTSEGTKIQDGVKNYRLGVYAATKAEDGMEMYLFESFESPDEAHLPNDAQVQAAIKKVADNLAKLRTAPVVEPYAGPAILSNRAAAVFFHEIFGHRIEGHRQKDEDEGQTFTKKVGQKIMPEFISIVDDPTLDKFSDTFLLGHYAFDDEGVVAQKVPIVENGVLKNFLMSRSPVKGFPKSNGHGRCQAGRDVVARQGNLMIQSTNRVPVDKLRQMLIDEAKKQGKPYGLIFNDISGGFTFTGRGFAQVFKVLPLLVTRVYVDGRPDEIVRGVDIVGTPILCLEQMIATGDDEGCFNGHCGAESGSVPVSAISPSVLVSNIEIEKRQKAHDRLPILPAPLHDPKDKK
jgi:TldD protein